MKNKENMNLQGEVNFEAGMNDDGRLSEHDSLRLQEMATEAEGKKFSEQASPESYHQAEKKLLAELQSSHTEWLGIDLSSVEVDESGQIPAEVQSRLKIAAEVLSKSTTQKSKKPTGLKRQAASAIVPWMAAASLIISSCAQRQPTPEEVQQYQQEFQVELQVAKADTELVIGEGIEMDDEYMVAIEQWKQEHPEVARVIIGSPILLRNNIWSHKIPITVIHQDGNTKILEGWADFRAHQIMDPSEEQVLTIKKREIGTGVTMALYKHGYSIEADRLNK